jgi:hypothetical protein
MPNATAIEQFERRLIEMGCPARRLQEQVRELADHYEDLKLAALEDGLSEPEAEARATALLGNPVMLAENIVAGLRESSWWGRHPFIGFVLLPPLGFVFVWAACGGALFGLCRLLGWIFGRAYDFDEKTASALSGDPGAFHSITGPLNASLHALSFMILTAGLCRLARRSAVGLKWVLATCAACLLTSLFFCYSIRPHFLIVLLTWPSPYWPDAGIPLAVALVAGVRQRRMESRLAPIPHGVKGGRLGGSVKASLLRRLCNTPTYWVMAVLAALVLAFVIKTKAASIREASRKAELQITQVNKLKQKTNKTSQETP